jgi:predicted amidohydrolase
MDQTVSSTPLTIRVVACQQPLHELVSADSLQRIRSFSPDFVSLPEHYPLPLEVQNIRQSAQLFEQRKEYLRSLSVDLSTVLIGGTLTEWTADGYYNTCYVFDRGKELGFYRKVYPTSREQESGILRGSEFKMFEIRGVRVGVLICADVLFEESFQELSIFKCHIVFIPTASPLRPGESMEEKFERDRTIFVEAAHKLQCPVVKTCGVGTTFGHPIQGRSLIATQEGVLTRAQPHQEKDQLILFAELEVSDER